MIRKKRFYQAKYNFYREKLTIYSCKNPLIICVITIKITSLKKDLSMDINLWMGPEIGNLVKTPSPLPPVELLKSAEQLEHHC